MNEILHFLLNNYGQYVIPLLCVIAIAQQFVIGLQQKSFRLEEERSMYYYKAYVAAAFPDEIPNVEDDEFPDEDDEDDLDLDYIHEDDFDFDFDNELERDSGYEHGHMVFSSPEEEEEYNMLLTRYASWKVRNGVPEASTSGYPRLVGNVVEIDQNTGPITIKLIRPAMYDHDEMEDVEDFDSRI